jgi:hypothetical protein
MIGPGIEEEYADALARIRQLREILAQFPPSNDTFEGRMVFQLNWLEQEIDAQRLPIPLAPEHRATLTYLIAEGSLDYLPGTIRAMSDLNEILDGTGLLKQRQFPVVVAMIDELVALVRAHIKPLIPLDQEMFSELSSIRAAFEDGSARPPLEKAAYPASKQSFRSDRLAKIPGFRQMGISLSFVLFEGSRPPACKKPPFPAPNPGLRTLGAK